METVKAATVLPLQAVRREAPEKVMEPERPRIAQLLRIRKWLIVVRARWALRVSRNIPWVHRQIVRPMKIPS